MCVWLSKIGAERLEAGQFSSVLYALPQVELCLKQSQKCWYKSYMHRQTHTHKMYLNADLQYPILQRLHYITSLMTLHDVRGSLFFCDECTLLV